MAIYMPGSQSNLQRHEYYKHGTCYSKDPNEYFYDALTMTKQADESLGEYLRANIGKRVKEIKIKMLAAKRWNALPPLDLNSTVKELMAIYMPGSQSNLQRHEYYKHGTCYSKDPNEYFYDALTMTKQADESLGEYLRANTGKRVKEIKIKMLAAKSFGKEAKYKVAIKCKRRVLSEIWFSLKGKGNDISKLVKDAKNIHSNCTTAIVDAPGKFRR